VVPGEVSRGGISEEGRGSGQSPEGLRGFVIRQRGRPARPMPAEGRQQAGAGPARPALRAALILKRTVRQLRAVACPAWFAC